MHKKWISNAAALLVALLLAGCGGDSADENSAAANQPRSAAQAAPVATSVGAMLLPDAGIQDVSPIKEYKQRSGQKPFSIDLPQLATGALLEKSSSTPNPGQPTQIGIARPVSHLTDSKKLSSLLRWAALPQGGKIAALRLKSVGAKGMRLGVRVERLPLAAVLRFHAANSATALEISAPEIMALIQRNVDAGDISEDAYTYWSPDLGGDDVTMEIELPSGMAAEEVQIFLPRISHVFAEAPGQNDLVEKVGEAGSCNIDVSCTPAYEADSRSVARMKFVKAGDSYLCTGTLLNNTTGNGIPYFLSANHCISTQTVASTLSTDWFYRSSSCNSGVLNSSFKTQTGGATLLYNTAVTDTSFMRLNSAIPLGATYAGWSSTSQALGVNVLGLHQPRGDLQKSNVGSIVGFASCTPSTLSFFSCISSALQGSNHLMTRWNAGTTEGGSSGSGLFITSNGSRYLVGQLHGGSGSCTNQSGSDYYGRFDLAYTAALSQWLSPAADRGQRNPVYRFFNASTGAHFYTDSAAERDKVAETYAQFQYEGIAFYSYGSSVVGTSSVFRFYNNRTASHFYTISSTERDFVRTTLPWFTYEGIGWYANLAPASTATPLYRFYNAGAATHFYTVSLGERDLIIQKYPQYAYEGIGYYVWDAL